MKPNVRIVLDTRRAKLNSEKYPVKLRITHLKVQKYYPVGLDISKDQFHLILNASLINQEKSVKIRRQLNDWKMICDARLIKATELIDKMPVFSFSAFDLQWNAKRRLHNDVFSYFENTIDRFKANGQIGTATNYQTSMNSLKRFKNKLTFGEITVDFLRSYEKWLVEKGKSTTTVGIYIRPLRAVLNEAIDSGVISRESGYPFGKRRYQIPASRNIKKALSREEIGLILKYPAEERSWEQRARDMFVFSYLCNGINMKDIALLTYGNIEGDQIRFIRAKTKHATRSLSKPISVFLVDQAKEIIRRWGNKDRAKENYVFDVLEKGITPEREQRLIQQFTKMVNKYLAQIAEKVGIDKPVTTYYARHSFATILRNSGAPTAFISESLGHTNLKTTEFYLDSFDNEIRKTWSARLLDLFEESNT